MQTAELYREAHPGQSMSAKTGTELKRNAAEFLVQKGNKNDRLDRVTNHQTRTGQMMSQSNSVLGTYNYL